MIYIARTSGCLGVRRTSYRDRRLFAGARLDYRHRRPLDGDHHHAVDPGGAGDFLRPDGYRSFDGDAVLPNCHIAWLRSALVRDLVCDQYGIGLLDAAVRLQPVLNEVGGPEGQDDGRHLKIVHAICLAYDLGARFVHNDSINYYLVTRFDVYLTRAAQAQRVTRRIPQDQLFRHTL